MVVQFLLRSGLVQLRADRSPRDVRCVRGHGPKGVSSLWNMIRLSPPASGAPMSLDSSMARAALLSVDVAQVAPSILITISSGSEPPSVVFTSTYSGIFRQHLADRCVPCIVQTTLPSPNGPLFVAPTNVDSLRQSFRSFVSSEHKHRL